MACNGKWFVLSLCFLGALALRGNGSDWPQWGGTYSRNMASVEKGLPVHFLPGKKRSDGSGIDLTTTCNVRWVAQLGSENYSSPVIADGKVFIGTNDANLHDPRYRPTQGGMLLCLDEHSGKKLWQLVVPKLLGGHRSHDFDQMNLGICSTPAVDDHHVYVVSNRCDVLCLDENGLADGNQGPFTDECRYTVEPGQRPVEPQSGDGDILWRFDMMNRLPVFPHDAVSSSPLVYGDCVYVGTGNGVEDKRIPMPMAASLIALDKHDGHLIARDDATISSHVFHGQWSSPSLGLVGEESLVFFGGSDGVCYAFDAVQPTTATTGWLHRAWSFDCNPPEHRWHSGRLVNYWEGDKRENRGNHDDWNYEGLNEIIGTPVFYKNRAYVAVGRDPLHGVRTKGGLFCIDATKSGDISSEGKIWSYDGIGRSLSTVSIADGLLYAADEVGRVHCLDADTGQLYWVYDTGSDIWDSTLVADGKVFVGTRRGLCVLEAGKKKNVLADVHLGSAVRSTPTVADDTLFVASQRYLWAVELSKPHVLAGAPAEHKAVEHKGG